ncbi:sugar transferase [Lactovum miscens]|uniref:Lipopolysaccharide/colanic/teichoic acid biosynthesis glycosyltransferase n=1 Tax=Lactovum miscens TaxID=190387 RepID=A0A841C9X4_9LACT|nr:sugar transferase [Lactovum miscens]MBB5887990.1 lipopolysaccharide/colanic/teichoic acid biosynthesis glycosyltransferase [Lactovum miscens]
MEEGNSLFLMDKHHHREYDEILIKKGLVDLKKWSMTELFIKRFLDIFGGIVGTLICIIVALILIIPYITSNEKDKGPIFFKQKRRGVHGEIFYILKFRTMIVDADTYLENHPKVKQKYHENGNKLLDDPRITRLGQFIRQYSIDELPQFINVLKGDMALVGPRPILLFEAKEYAEKLPYLLMCRPGITGFWTTHGRSKVLFPERADLELQYLKYHSTTKDIKLLAITICQIFKGTDAY